METSSEVIDPEDEVRKLKDLVRRLEHQNELLKSRPNLSNDFEQNTENTTNNDLSTNDALNISFDDIDILDVSQQNKPDEKEDSWLYESPKKASPAQNNISPYKWVRTDLENASPEVRKSRRSLSHRLDEVAKIAFQSSPFSSPGRLSNSGSPAVKQPLLGHINTNTFTRTKKSTRASVEDSSHETHLHEGHRNVSEIHALAKMQEESLRREATPMGKMNRNNSSVPSLHLSDGENTSPRSSNRSSPGRYEDSGGRRLSNGHHRGSFSSGSSPPDSPFGSNQYLDSKHLSNMENQSNKRLSNLTKQNLLNPRSPTNDSDLPLTYRVQRATSPNTLQKPHSQAVRGLRQPSPVRRSGGIPVPSSGKSIPRLGNTRGSGIPSPRRSAIPKNMKSNNYSASSGSDDSWKEGCY